MLGRLASRAVFCYSLTALVIAAVLYPLSFDKREDSFPLSSYPMFARFHPKPTLNEYYLVAASRGDAPEFRRSVPPELIANSEVLQAQATIRGAVRRGPRAMKALCAEVAARVARSPSFDRAGEVRLVKGTYDAIAYLTGTDTRGREVVRARCQVPR